MTLPTLYTEQTIIIYLKVTLDTVEDIVAISFSKWTEMANDLLVMYGVTDYANATDITKVRALAKVVAWKAAMEAVSAWYKYSADGGSYDRNQIFEMCQSNYKNALHDASAYGTDYEIKITEVSPIQSPYKYDPNRIDMRIYE